MTQNKHKTDQPENKNTDTNFELRIMGILSGMVVWEKIISKHIDPEITIGPSEKESVILPAETVPEKFSFITPFGSDDGFVVRIASGKMTGEIVISGIEYSVDELTGLEQTTTENLSGLEIVCVPVQPGDKGNFKIGEVNLEFIFSGSEFRPELKRNFSFSFQQVKFMILILVCSAALYGLVGIAISVIFKKPEKLQSQSRDTRFVEARIINRTDMTGDGLTTDITDETDVQDDAKDDVKDEVEDKDKDIDKNSGTE